MDMFAGRLNRQKEIFYSWKPDPLVAATDAFMMPWGNPTGVHVPTFLPDRQMSGKDKGGGSQGSPAGSGSQTVA